MAVVAWRLWRTLLAARDERDEALRQAQVLSDAARELNSTLDPEQVVAVAVRLAAEVASPPGSSGRRANYCQITDGMARLTAEWDEEGQWVGASWPLSEHPHLERAVRTRTPTRGKLDPTKLGPAVRDVNRSQCVGHGAWVPVTIEDQVQGVVAVAGRNRDVSERELARCVAIVQIMELALGNALAHERLQRLALTDPLTSLSNRRGLDELVGDRRHRGTLTVLALDLDGLKAVNDRYGHVAGDGLILAVADAIRSVARAGDVVARVGGDEFVCVAFDADEHEAGRVAERILEEVKGVRYRDVSPAVSIGVASAAPGVSLDTALQRADAAMYAAKRAGGMRYQLASRAEVVKAATGGRPREDLRA